MNVDELIEGFTARIRETLDHDLERLFSRYFGHRFESIDRRLSAIEETTLRTESKMAVDFSSLQADLQTLAAGYVAQQAIIKTQADALANADQATQDAVAAAIEENDAADQSVVDAADQVAKDALNPPVEPPVDEG